MTTREEDEFNAAFDERGMLKDGITHLKVPFRMIDSADDYEVHHFRGRAPLQVDSAAWDRAIADARARFKDRQPGFTTRDAVVRDALNDCYAQRDREQSEQWRNPPTGAGSHGPRGAAAGDICTVDGAPGHLREVDGALKCVPDKPRKASVDRADHHHQMMDNLYAERDRELCEQWRRTK